MQGVAPWMGKAEPLCLGVPKTSPKQQPQCEWSSNSPSSKGLLPADASLEAGASGLVQCSMGLPGGCSWGNAHRGMLIGDAHWGMLMARWGLLALVPSLQPAETL